MNGRHTHQDLDHLATLIGTIPGRLLLVATPRSERGGRWFDSSPRNSNPAR